MKIEQQAAQPRLRKGALLFGLIAATPVVQVVTHYALCDRHGAPACGNIGQLGAVTPPPPPIVVSPESGPVITTHNAPLVAISFAATLVAPPAEKPAEKQPVAKPPVELPAARPIADQTGQVVCGNVMGKGGSRRECRDRQGRYVPTSAED